MAYLLLLSLEREILTTLEPPHAATANNKGHTLSAHQVLGGELRPLIPRSFFDIPNIRPKVLPTRGLARRISLEKF
jgi:hypothetical protein